ncbi:MAG: electron transfer flavoprotein subunit alpha/FixB family protein, partial [Methylococcales bacterium]|nr:electron transfer flavoprotein subunit alpha/FixB family protein [Methylococcales bacterium]
MAILIIAELDKQSLSVECAKAVGAASKIGGDVHLLIAGDQVASAAEQGATLAGVTKVLVADNGCYQHQ